MVKTTARVFTDGFSWRSEGVASFDPRRKERLAFLCGDVTLADIAPLVGSGLSRPCALPGCM